LIDIGVEALHLGQTGLIGKFDTANRWWSETINRIRAYALKNARRHYVIINSHWSLHNFVGDHGRMLQDFNAYPCRIRAIAGQEDHVPTEENPQYCDLPIGYQCAPYKADKMGITPSGEFTEHYPYLVEFDNYDAAQGDAVWGMDESSWIANQSDDYRRSFYTEVRKMVAAFNNNGHVALLGKRPASTKKAHGYYYMNNSKYFSDGFSDEEAIIAAFKAYK
jgi:hypothetical protein